jgi:hypothetical protein
VCASHDPDAYSLVTFPFLEIGGVRGRQFRIRGPILIIRLITSACR